MRHIIITAIFLILLNNSALAHKCVLDSNSAKDIMVYNACKNDLATGVAGHDQTIKANRIAELEKENERLQNKIIVLKNHLLKLLMLID